MKIKLHKYLHSLLSKHFVSHHLPKLVFPLEPSDPHRKAVKGQFVVSKKAFLKYWNEKLTLQHRKQALCFFMPELIDLVNKTNSRLLYDDLVKSISRSKSQELSTDDENLYQLLNVFEMLWNVDKTKQESDHTQGQTSEALDLIA